MTKTGTVTCRWMSRPPTTQLSSRLRVSDHRRRHADCHHHHVYHCHCHLLAPAAPASTLTLLHSLPGNCRRETVFTYCVCSRTKGMLPIHAVLSSSSKTYFKCLGVFSIFISEMLFDICFLLYLYLCSIFSKSYLAKYNACFRLII